MKYIVYLALISIFASSEINPVSAIRILSIDDGVEERAKENPAKKAEDTIEEK